MLRVNVVTGDGPVDWVFADLLARLDAHLPEVEFIRTAEPVSDTICDVLHFYRPQAAVDIGNLTQAVLTHHGFGKRWKQGKVQDLHGEDDFAAHRRAGMTLVLNSIDWAILLENGVKPERIMTVPHAVDTSVFTPRPQHDPQLPLVIGRVGRPYGPCDDENAGEENKGRATLRAIMRELAPEADDLFWILMGSGWEEDIAFAHDHGHDCMYVERVPDGYPRDYVAAYHQMDAYLVTSRSEGGPASLPEAMACGVWPITTPVGMCTDLVGAGTGDLYPVNGHAVAADLILAKLADRAGLENARGAVREKVAGWTWGAWAQAHLQAYERVTSNGHICEARR